MTGGPLRIVHVEAGRRLYGGALQVRYLMQGLAERGVENILACPAGAEVGKPYPLAKHAPGSRTAGISQVPVPMRGDMDLALLPRLVALLRRTRADIVHVHSRRGADVLGGLAACCAGVPAVLSRRVDNPDPAWLARGKGALYGRVITISEAILRVQRRAGVPMAKLRCVHSAVDTARYRPGGDRAWLRREFDLPASGPVLGVIAQLIGRKGHRHLLPALPALRRRHPGLTVLLLGIGPEETGLRQLVSDLGLAPVVRFAGFRRDLPQILPALDLVVHPADREGLGVALLQAAACGIPVVASRTGGIPECIRHGENGLLVPVAHTTVLQAAITVILADPGLARQFGDTGRQLMKQCFSREAMVQGNVNVYRELVTHHTGIQAQGK